MSVLAMILMTAMAIPQNGPEMVSGEMEQVKLDLSGTWEGAWQTVGKKSGKATLDSSGELHWYFPKQNKLLAIGHFKAEDVGDGKLRIKWSGNYRGFYRYVGDSVIISFAVEGYPASVESTRIGEFLLILHRVKPRQ